jgi:arginine:ornithine antiporter/lysine permease
MTTSLIQLVLLTTLFSEDAFLFTLKLCSALALIPYLLVAAYGLKLARSGETYDVDAQDAGKDLIIAGVATVYTAFALIAGGLKFVLLSCVIYAPGTYLYLRARREERQQPFSATERILFVILIVGAIAGVIGLITGMITI